MKKMTLISRFLICLLLASCAPAENSINRTAERTSNYYTTSFPNRDLGGKLPEIQRSVNRILSTGTFTTYYFDKQPLTKEQLESASLRELADRRIQSEESTAGTAITLYSGRRTGVLITNNHVIDFPDTLISYRKGKDVPPYTLIESVQVQENVTHLLYELPNLAAFEVIARDRQGDLALLKVDLSGNDRVNLTPLQIPTGDSRRLRLGSFVYILGYPRGNPMITRGIVSDPGRGLYGSFLTDALFNPGISGGLIMASRDHFSTLEWVGMASTASASTEPLLAPNPLRAGELNNLDLYAEIPFVRQKTTIDYGITQAIPTSRITTFLNDHDKLLRRLGFDSSAYNTY